MKNYAYEFLERIHNTGLVAPRDKEDTFFGNINFAITLIPFFLLISYMLLVTERKDKLLFKNLFY
jgi:hypothetical protein